MPFFVFVRTALFIRSTHFFPSSNNNSSNFELAAGSVCTVCKVLNDDLKSFTIPGSATCVTATACVRRASKRVVRAFASFCFLFFKLQIIVLHSMIISSNTLAFFRGIGFLVVPCSSIHSAHTSIVFFFNGHLNCGCPGFNSLQRPMASARSCGFCVCLKILVVLTRRAAVETSLEEVLEDATPLSSVAAVSWSAGSS